MTIAFRYTGPGRFYGVPDRDITDEELAALPPHLRRRVKQSGAYEAVTDADSDLHDPFKSLSNAQYDALSPVEKGARTREFNRLAEEGANGNQQGETPDADGGEE